jgi:hypothetical protein
MRSRIALVLTPLLATAGIIVAVVVGGTDPERNGAGPARAPERFEEAEEQRETTELRLEALAEARHRGVAGKTGRINQKPAAGWAGEQLLDATGDDWEPAVAADPNAPYVYVLTTRYGAPKPCKGNCPIPHIAIEISADNGATWTQGRPLCPCKGSGQFDPIIEVVPGTGHVYALWMNGFNVVFQKSTDHGATWSSPVPTWGQVSWNDKPVLATSDDGRDVYISWNGPTGGDPWVAQSHDFGQTWSQTKLVNSGRYFFAFDADVLPDGTVILSESSFDYSGPAGSAVGSVLHHAFVSRDRGASWENQVIDRVELGEPCVSEGCYADFYAGHSGVTADGDGDLVIIYDGATSPGGPQRTFVRRSTDGGATWSARTAISPQARMTTGPAVEATGDGDVRAWYAERRSGRWNIFSRRSLDGGATWSSAVRISDATSGAAYKNKDGFLVLEELVEILDRMSRHRFDALLTLHPAPEDQRRNRQCGRIAIDFLAALSDDRQPLLHLIDCRTIQVEFIRVARRQSPCNLLTVAPDNHRHSRSRDACGRANHLTDPEVFSVITGSSILLDTGDDLQRFLVGRVDQAAVERDRALALGGADRAEDVGPLRALVVGGGPPRGAPPPRRGGGGRPGGGGGGGPGPGAPRSTSWLARRRRRTPKWRYTLACATVATVIPQAPAWSWRSTSCGDMVVLPCGAMSTAWSRQ